MLLSHIMLGHSMQMVVNQGGELLEGGLVALAPGVEQLGGVGGPAFGRCPIEVPIGGLDERAGRCAVRAIEAEQRGKSLRR